MQIQDIASKLQSVGLSEKQAKVYVAAAFLGPSAVQKIATQSGINRATTYVILDELAQMGLVTESTHNKKTVFVAEPPSALQDYLDRQNQAIVNKQQELKGLLPDLEQISNTTNMLNAPRVRYYTDKPGLAQATAEMIRKAKPKSEVYELTNLDVQSQLTPPAELEQTLVAMRKKQLFQKILYYADQKQLQSSNDKMLHVKSLLYPNTAQISLYPDMMRIITYNDQQPSTIVIESPEVAQSLRLIFELAWDNYQAQ